MIIVFLILRFLTLTFLVAVELYLIAGFFILSSGLAAWGNGDIPPSTLPWILDNLTLIFSAAVSYILIGAVYSVPKWALFGKNIREKLDNYIKSGNPIPQFLDGDTTDDVNRRLKSWNPYISNLEVSVSKNLPYKVQFDIPIGKSKFRLISWMIFWPFSLTATLVEDFVVKIYERLYQALSQMYAKITTRTFQDLN